MRLAALRAARELALPDWCLAAGFVRNLCWDRLHDYPLTTPLNDLDLIFFDPDETDAGRDLALERQLHEATGQPWSVKNQARMHLRNTDAPYVDSADAMRHWVEVETAIGVRLLADDRLELIAPLGIDSLLAGRLTLNPVRRKPEAFKRRIEDKSWLRHWPRLRIVEPCATDRPTLPPSIPEPEEDTP